MSAMPVPATLESYDLREIGYALNLSHEKTYGKKPDRRTFIELLELIINRPFEMPKFLRDWLRSFRLDYENDTISWLKQYA